MGLILNELLEDSKNYETELSKQAKKHQMKMLAMETVEFQMSIVQKISIETQIKNTYSNISDTDLSKEYAKLLKAYKNQDLQELNNLTKEDDAGIENFEELFLIDRNNNWIPIVEKFASEQSTFFAVGAAHLPGKNGLIALLRSEGYKITAVF